LTNKSWIASVGRLHPPGGSNLDEDFEGAAVREPTSQLEDAAANVNLTPC